MKSYPEETKITIEVPVQTASGESFSEECSFDWTLMDSDSQKLTEGKGTSSEGKAVITIDAEFGKVPEGQAKDIRALIVNMATETETLATQKIYYALVAKNPLIVGENSFVTLEKFYLIASMTPGLDQVDTANEADLVTSLLESYQRISTHRFRLPYSSIRMENVGYKSEIAWRPRAITDADPLGIYTHSFKITDLTSDEFENLPSDFKDALMKAQVIEANSILAPTDTIEERRRKGVILETIHEVKMMFSSTTPVQTTLAKDALVVLAPYLDNTIRIGRA